MLVEGETSGLMLTLRQVPCLFVQRNHLCLISKWSLRCFHTTHWSYHEKNCNPWNIFTCLGFKCCSSKLLANGNALSQSWQVINATINLPCSFQPCITHLILSYRILTVTWNPLHKRMKMFLWPLICIPMSQHLESGIQNTNRKTDRLWHGLISKKKAREGERCFNAQAPTCLPYL